MMVFKTSDLQLSAFLVTVGHKLIGVEGPRGRREGGTCQRE